MDKENKPKTNNAPQAKKISLTNKSLMIALAGIFDVLQFAVNFIPIAGQILSFLLTILAQMTFWLWFRLLGFNFFSKSTVIMAIVEFIPIINDLPTTLSAVIKRIIDIEASKLAPALPSKRLVNN